MSHSLTLIIHIYYKSSWQLIKSKAGYLLSNATQVLITGCYDEVLSEIDLENAVLLKVPNVGKDIGGKLAAIAYYLQFGAKTTYMVFLHDKISPQSLNADYWLAELYSITEENLFLKMLRAFERHKETGIIGGKTFLKNEYIPGLGTFDTLNDVLLRKLINRYQLRCKKFDYIAGTMFMARSVIFETFFSEHHPLGIRSELEAGNVLDEDEGTATHCWERLFCFIAWHYNYTVKGM